MHTKNPFNFQYTYLSLPDKFYSLVNPESFPKPDLLLLNQVLCNELKISNKNYEDLLDTLLVKKSNTHTTSYAQAYAGHQFGHFTKLGDGRAIIIGEHTLNTKQLFDIQIKGSGRTPYSRGGDGKATLKAMLREYLISEAMHYLRIPTSRSLAVIKTGDKVFRETVHEGAALIRVMKSHIRVGTFEYAARFTSKDDLKTFFIYTAKRLHPEVFEDENPVLSFLKKVMAIQINLVVEWMRVGFIHGVMNTDNTSISGETFDYGPCAFINAFHPDTVYSSIDQYGRYAFGNQARIIKWNIARFAETLLPIMHENMEVSLALAQNAIDEFDAIWQKEYYGMMLKKIGMQNHNTKNYALINELLDLMKKQKMDYTNTFRDLSAKLHLEDGKTGNTEFDSWLIKWKKTIAKTVGKEHAIKLINEHNPFVIPRNHMVENALDEAVSGNMKPFEKILTILSKPYQYQAGIEEFIKPPEINFESNYQTFCGT
jgi:uncharacterized protein YdiU (UPF0061 family)